MENMKFIDLGLPSGNLWTEANFIMEDKDSFQWAYTSANKINDEECAPFIKNVEFDDKGGKKKYIEMLSKYCTFSCYGEEDGKVTLELSDDIANKIGNKKWRIPSALDFIELLDVDLCTLESDSKNNGIWVISKSNGNKIFFKKGNYWSRSLNEINPLEAFAMLVDCSFPIYRYNISITPEYRGKSNFIRPIMIKR